MHFQLSIKAQYNIKIIWTFRKFISTIHQTSENNCTSETGHKRTTYLSGITQISLSELGSIFEWQPSRKIRAYYLSQKIHKNSTLIKYRVRYSMLIARITYFNEKFQFWDKSLLSLIFWPQYLFLSTMQLALDLILKTISFTS